MRYKNYLSAKQAIKQYRKLMESKREVQTAIDNTQKELDSLPIAIMFCSEDDYQENLELKWHKRELKESLVKYKLQLNWINKN